MYSTTKSGFTGVGLPLKMVLVQFVVSNGAVWFIVSVSHNINPVVGNVTDGISLTSNANVTWLDVHPESVSVTVAVTVILGALKFAGKWLGITTLFPCVSVPVKFIW